MTDVLVVGAGPVGLAAAHELARRGVSIRVVDRLPEPARVGRATANHPRTLEVYHQMGVVDELLARGNVVRRCTVHRAGRAVLRLGSDYRELPTRYPFTLQVAQDIVEETLRERLSRLGVTVEWSTTVTDLTQQDSGVFVQLSCPDGQDEVLAVPWLVGADGGHSTVRELVGVPMTGESTEVWLSADAQLTVDLPRDSVHLLGTPEGALLLAPVGAPGQWRLLDTAPGSSSDVAERLGARIAHAVGRQVDVPVLHWVSEFTVQQRMAGRIHLGHCFLVGDAAHVHSPASGQGMCTGIQDAVNLAWKLASVVQGHATPELLDTYEAERQPVHERLLASTRTAATMLSSPKGALAAAARQVGSMTLRVLPPARRLVQRRVHRAMSGLALSYEDGPLTEPGTSSKGIQPGQRVACTAESELRSPAWSELCREATDPRWTMLVFANGDSAQAELVRGIASRFGAVVSVRTVTAGAAREWPHPVLDPRSALRKAFALAPGDYALIRPDGYLASKGTLDADIEGLFRRFHLREHGRRTPAERGHDAVR